MMNYKSISEYFFDAAIDSKIFLYLEDKNVTYGEIKQKCLNFISFVLQNKLEERDFYISSSSPEIIIVSFLALNYMNKDAHIISDNVKILLLEDIKNQKSGGNCIFVTDEIAVSEEKENFVVNYEDFVKKEFDKTEVEKFLSNICERNSSLIQFTSGTTGKPSKIIRTKDSCIVEALDLIEVWKYDSNSKIACFTPFSYSFAFGNVVVACILASASIISCKKFNIRCASELLMKNQATHFVTVVSIIKLLMLQKKSEDFSFLKYLVCSGSKFNFKDEKRFYKKFKVHVSEQYGMTETGALLYSYISKDYFTNSFPSVEYRIENDNLFVKRQNTNLAEIKTNDYAVLKKNKFIKIVGRADSVFKLDDKRYSVEYISSLFENEDYLTIAKKLLSNKKLVLHYNKENEKNVKEIIEKLKKLDSSIKIKKKLIK